MAPVQTDTDLLDDALKNKTILPSVIPLRAVNTPDWH